MTYAEMIVLLKAILCALPEDDPVRADVQAAMQEIETTLMDR